MTGAGNLKARQVIHAVGPRMGEGDEDKKLAAAVRAALALADRRGMKSIALPAISTGNFGFPIDRAARIMLTEIHRFLQGGRSSKGRRLPPRRGGLRHLQARAAPRVPVKSLDAPASPPPSSSSARARRGTSAPPRGRWPTWGSTG